MKVRFSMIVMGSVLLLSACSSHENPPTYSSSAPGIHVGSGQIYPVGSMATSERDRSSQANSELEAHSKRDNALIAENTKYIESLRKMGADVRGTDRGVVINLPDVLFDFDRHTLTQRAKIILSDIASVLRPIATRSISVEGHTDSIGKVLYNKQLSLRRAEAVAGELRSHGVRGLGIQVRGLGEGYPVATNNSPEGQSKNRRVEIVIEN